MKVLLIANINSTHTRKWALALKEKQIEVALFSINAPVLPDRWYEQIDNVFYPRRDHFFIIKYIQLYFRLKEHIRTFKPDIIHSHFITNYSLLANLVRFPKHMITAWGSDIFLYPRKNIFTKFIVKYNLSRATSILSTSHVMADEIRRYTRKPVDVVPFGIDFTAFTARQHQAKEPGKFIIGHFKKIETVYAPEVILKAFSSVCQQLPTFDLKLMMVGTGRQLNAMIRLAADLGISEKVEFPGWVAADQVPELLSKLHLCIYLSRRESFGVALIEAMAAKVPLVVTPTVGFLEVGVNENNLLFAEFDNPEHAAKQMIRLLTDPELYHTLAENAYHHAKAHYDLEANITEQIRLYKRMLNAGT